MNQGSGTRFSSSDPAVAVGSEPVVTSMAASIVERTPFYFGPTERPLFGWYHRPRSGDQSRLGVVICPPLGVEYSNSHRSLKHLSDQLAAAGMPVFRFDYDGTGDSAGADEDPDRLDYWLQSIREAILHLRNISDCSEIGLLGLRMGGTFAAMTASATEIACLVLWAPCSRGRTYLRELKAMQLSSSSQPQAAGVSNSGFMEAGGFVFSGQTQASLKDLDLNDLSPKAKRILVAGRDDVPEKRDFAEKWARSGNTVDHRVLPGYADMMAEPHETTVPHDALAELVEWFAIDARKADVVSGASPAGNFAPTVQFTPPAVCDQTLDTNKATVRETIVRYGPSESRFGILSEPENKPAQNQPVIVLSNAGAVHHVGPNRLYTLLARTLSATGFRCFRFDLPGLGDSPPDEPGQENNVYPAGASAEIALVLEMLTRRFDAGSFVLTGLCSGAHASFHAGLDVAVAGIVECLLVNPLTFYYKPGMSLSQQPARHFAQWQSYVVASRSLDRWQKLFRGDVNMMALSRTFSRQAGLKTRSFLQRCFRAVRRPPESATGELNGDLARLAASGIQLTFLFARDDPGYSLLLTHAASTVRRLTRRGSAEIRFIENADHTFSSKRPRCEAIAAIQSHLIARYRSDETSTSA